VLTAAEAAAMAKRLTTPRWWPSRGVASAPVDDPDFHPRCYWQGPLWVNMNWLLADGLDRYGQTALAARLRSETVDTVDSAGGMFEYFSPIDGEGIGSDSFSWTAALAIDILAQRAASQR
jgi:glycogen debranching enzyme